MSTIGERIKKKREQDNLSARELAEKLGVTKENVYKWENGSVPSDPVIFMKIEKWLESENSINTEDKIIPSDGGSLTIMHVLANLSESHKNLTAAHKEISESNNKLADNERMILTKMSIADDPNNVLNDASVLVPLAEILADLANGNLHFRSKKEALAELGIRLGLHKPGRASRKRTPSGEDR